MCPLLRVGWTAKDPAHMLANRLTRVTNDFIAQTLSDDPLSTVSTDEVRPFHIKIWVAVAVKCVTCKIYLIPMKTTSTEQFLMTLEIPQSRCGHITKLVVDNHTSNSGLRSKGTELLRSVSTILQKMVDGDADNDQKKVLEEKGIYIAVAESKCHSRVGLAEAAIHKVEHALFHLFPGSPQCLNLFEFNHYLALIEVYLNQQPVYTDHDSYLTPYLWDIASLKRC